MGNFYKAVKHAAPARIAITGPSGSGKTFTALKIATALVADHAPGTAVKRIAVVDTERGSASKYSDLFDFDVLEMEPPYHPDRYVAALQEAEAAGCYGVVILDSLSHGWIGTGGLLEEIDRIAARKTNGNSFAAWKEGTPIHNNLLNAITGTKLHIIGTIRSKMDYVLEKDEKTGKTKPVKVGLAPIQRDGLEYEFDVVLDMDLENVANVTKSRCPELNGRVIRKPGAEVAATMLEWLKGLPAREMTLDEAGSVLSPKGTPLARLDAVKWGMLVNSPSAEITNHQRKAAKLLLADWEAKQNEKANAAGAGRTATMPAASGDPAHALMGNDQQHLEQHPEQSQPEPEEPQYAPLEPSA